jgi:hypothetical protein
MKDIVFVQRNWREAFFQPIAVSGGLDDLTQANIRYELGKEVEWLIRIPDPNEGLNLRLAKIETLLLAHEGNISSFDSYYEYRKLFYEWVLT